MLQFQITWRRNLRYLVILVWELLRDGLQFIDVIARSRTAVAAEVLFLRKQLAYYQDHKIRPRRLSDGARLSLVLWSHLFDWKKGLAIVTPATFIRWHRRSFKLYWRWKSRGGRPQLPREIRQLIARLVRENVTWGEERIADELSLKLGIYVSPRTVRKYWPQPPGGTGRIRTSSQHWRTFVQNHAQGIVACDFLVAVTVRFQVLLVFIAMEVGSRRILHYNVTAHPTSGWTLQQFREAMPSDHGYQFLIHDPNLWSSPQTFGGLARRPSNFSLPFHFLDGLILTLRSCIRGRLASDPGFPLRRLFLAHAIPSFPRLCEYARAHYPYAANWVLGRQANRSVH